MTARNSEEARYGQRRVSKMIREVEQLRTAIRSHDSEATEAAWDRVEQHIDYAYRDMPDAVLQNSINALHRERTNMIATHRDSIKRLTESRDTLAARVLELEAALQSVAQFDRSHWFGPDGERNKRRAWKGVMRGVRAALNPTEEGEG